LQPKQEVYALKAVSIIGVVLYHVSNRRFDADLLNTILFSRKFFMWCVMAFIFAAGFLYAETIVHKRKGFMQYLWQRCRRLLMPWVIVVFAYSLIWQALQIALPSFGLQSIPSSFMEKLFYSFLPIYKTPGKCSVGEQLYFFPLLFAIQLLCHSAFLIANKKGVLTLIIFFCGFGIIFFPQVDTSGTTGFSINTFVWGVVLYGLGCLKSMLVPRSFYYLSFLILVSSATLGSLITLVKFVPLFLFEFFQKVRLPPFKRVFTLGKASGTIFVYHTPFVIMPLTVLISFFPKQIQLPFVFIAIFSTLFVLTFIHIKLSSSLFKRLLF